MAAAGGFMLLKAWRRRKGRHELDTTADDEPAPVSKRNSEPIVLQERLATNVGFVAQLFGQFWPIGHTA